MLELLLLTKPPVLLYNNSVKRYLISKFYHKSLIGATKLTPQTKKGINPYDQHPLAH